MHNAGAKNVLKILEIEVHMWKLNELTDWVLFLIGVPRFQKQPLVPLGTDMKYWHIFWIKAVASFLGMLSQLRFFCQNTRRLENVLWVWFLKNVTSGRCTLHHNCGTWSCEQCPLCPVSFVDLRADGADGIMLSTECLCSQLLDSTICLCQAFKLNMQTL